MPKIATPRYSKPRKYILFNTDELMCLKMLAYCLRKYEAACRDKYVLWNRTEELCYPVLASVLEKGYTFKELRTWVKEQRGLTLTPNVLYQRADKAGRYTEFNIHLKCVEASYKSLTQPQDVVNMKGRTRSFSDAVLEQVVKEQGGRCYYRDCSLDEGVVGDHLKSFSKGGSTTKDNCVASCVRCNQEKGAMSAFEFGKLVGAQNSRGRKLNAKNTNKA